MKYWIRRTGLAAAAAAAVVGTALWPGGAQAVTPSQDACHTTANSMPRGNCGRFLQVLAENFNGDRVPLGSFADCDHSSGSRAAYCGRLTGDYRKNFWAYPTGWQDTAKSNGWPVGGTYHPEDTVSVSPAADGDGQMHIRMWRPARGGDVHSAAVLPKPVKYQRYGKYSERFRVSRIAAGYKSAHLLWPVNDAACPGCEMDFPEGEWNGRISAYHHPRGGGDQDAYETTAKWSAWHTSTVEWTPGHTRYYLDGRLIGHSVRGVPDTPHDWILQNEAALNGQYAAPGSWAQMDITWVAAYSYH